MTPRPYTEDRARRETKWVRNALTAAFFSLNTAGEQIRRIYAGRGHEALGYETWEGYVAGEFGDLRAHLTRADREFLHVELTKGEVPMSLRAVAAVTGASPATVSRDAAKVSHDETPAARAAVRGLDGKTYLPARRSEPAPTPKPVAVAVVEFAPDDERAARHVLMDISNAVQVLAELPADAVRAAISREAWDELTAWRWGRHQPLRRVGEGR